MASTFRQARVRPKLGFGGSRSVLVRPRTLVLIGGLALALGVWGVHDHIGFMVSAERAEAEVLAVETLDRGEGFPLYRPSVRFATPSGSVTATAAETYRPTIAGEMLPVAYDPAAPTDVRLMDPRDRWLLPLWMVVFGIVTIVIGFRRARSVSAPDPQQ